MRLFWLDSEEFRYLRKWSTIATLIGVISGVGAIIFYELLNLGTELFLGKGAGFVPPRAGVSLHEALAWTPPPEPLMILPVIVLGGLLSGILVFTLAPEAEGHGTDAAIRAFHREGGRIRRRIPLVKMAASVLTISTGGSAGREGPIAQIGAGFGSLVGEVFRLSERDRRIALAVGIGAGVGSIFKAPLGGALLSTEILYRQDFEKEALIPSVIASVVGYSIFAMYDGFSPVFAAQPYQWSLAQIPLYMLLGAACAGVGILYIKAFYSTKAFDRLKIKRHIKPALGALAVGVLALALMEALPQAKGAAGLGALGMGYGFIQLALYNALPLEVMFTLIFAKIAATALTIGSGGSGGVFAQGMVIGAMVGGTVGAIFAELFPGLVTPEAVPAFVIIGMMALFGGVSKAPIAVLIMVSEMTGDYSLLFPAMVAIVGSYSLTGKHSIYSEQVPTRIHSPAHAEEYFRDLLRIHRVSDAMRSEFPTTTRGESLSGAMLKMRHGVSALPIVERGRIEGIVRLRDIVAVPVEKWGETRVEEVMREKYSTITPDRSLYEALDFMERRGVGTLVVVSPEDPEKPLGLLLKRDVIKIGEAKLGKKPNT
ncbi:MAG: chloride channel protein [Euryarchaeota archaeon]|nr:chloride channel protein [Euryarchaeota archaeon]